MALDWMDGMIVLFLHLWALLVDWTRTRRFYECSCLEKEDLLVGIFYSWDTFFLSLPAGRFLLTTSNGLLFGEAALYIHILQF